MEQRAAAERAAAERLAAEQAAAQQYQPAVAESPRSRTPFVILGVLTLVFIVGFGALAYFFLKDAGGGDANVSGNANADPSNVNANSNAVANANSNVGANVSPNDNAAPPDRPARPELVAMPGGTFRAGRSDVPPITDALKAQRPAYLLWMYNQWPAHDVPVSPFAIDRTEVTNEEYAEFVKATGHEPPSDWGGSEPPPGRESLPVTNVTFDDARAFADWRSRRDGARYRLPSEDEWEYAATGGSPRAYPWGERWSQGYANLAGAGPAPVGSFTLGRTAQGVEDMIGNVWEWTSSEAAMYKGNDRTVLDKADKGKLVVRGGSYESRPDGDEPVTATSRRWVAREFRSPVLGFRLVRDAR
jgi:formylglycine-generating enzyme required for sulfatase activity